MSICGNMNILFRKFNINIKDLVDSSISKKKIKYLLKNFNDL